MLTKTASKEETQKVGEGIAKNIKNGGIVCLYGDLGAGKTTLTQGIARGLGIKKTVISPTFILMRRYDLKNRFLYHIDLYRLNSLEEVRGLGIEEITGDPKNIVIIEWPEKIQSSLPRPRREVRLKNISETEREIVYETLH